MVGKRQKLQVLKATHTLLSRAAIHVDSEEYVSDADIFAVEDLEVNADDSESNENERQLKETEQLEVLHNSKRKSAVLYSSSSKLITVDTLKKTILSNVNELYIVNDAIDENQINAAVVRKQPPPVIQVTSSFGRKPGIQSRRQNNEIIHTNDSSSSSTNHCVVQRLGLGRSEIVPPLRPRTFGISMSNTTLPSAKSNCQTQHVSVRSNSRTPSRCRNKSAPKHSPQNHIQKSCLDGFNQLRSQLTVNKSRFVFVFLLLNFASLLFIIY